VATSALFVVKHHAQLMAFRRVLAARKPAQDDAVAEDEAAVPAVSVTSPPCAAAPVIPLLGKPRRIFGRVAVVPRELVRRLRRAHVRDGFSAQGVFKLTGQRSGLGISIIALTSFSSRCFSLFVCRRPRRALRPSRAFVFPAFPAVFPAFSIADNPKIESLKARAA
jgi:hypothetical protein